MAISKDLFLAILSMDAYNRGYGAGIELTGNEIGVATILTDSEEEFADPEAPEGTPTVGEDADFYAVAYTIGAGVDGLDAGTTVISYRGARRRDARSACVHLDTQGPPWHIEPAHRAFRKIDSAFGPMRHSSSSHTGRWSEPTACVSIRHAFTRGARPA